MSPDPEVVKLASDHDKSLQSELFLCQTCYMGDVNLALLKRGINVRPVGNYGLPQWLRVSIGLPHENAAFIAALKAVLA
jgi:histidinol-phosphate/aromatic aminotransferase/cobyric acid decarboxylase-like protein